MAEDDTQSLQIDSDWKKQAQEEKRRLAEQEAKERQAREAREARAPSAKSASAETSSRGRRELPPPSFDGIVQSIVTQAFFYLGEVASSAGQMVDLDAAKHQIDLLGVLETKTTGNLSSEESSLLDAALYEARMRFVSVASKYIL